MTDLNRGSDVALAAAPRADTRHGNERGDTPSRLGSRNAARLGALAGGILLVAACSAIPPQAVTDPLGLDGQEVAVAFPAALATLAVPGEGGGTFTFPDVEFDLPLGISPGQLTNAVALALTARLTGVDPGPDKITITDPHLMVRLWHGAATYEEADDDARIEAMLMTGSTIVFKKGSCFAGTCSYMYESGPRSLGDVRLTGDPLDTALSIVGSAPSPNEGSVSLTLQADPDELAGGTLILELEAAEGEIRF